MNINTLSKKHEITVKKLILTNLFLLLLIITFNIVIYYQYIPSLLSIIEERMASYSKYLSYIDKFNLLIKGLEISITNFSNIEYFEKLIYDLNEGFINKTNIDKYGELLNQLNYKFDKIYNITNKLCSSPVLMLEC